MTIDNRILDDDLNIRLVHLNETGEDKNDDGKDRENDSVSAGNALHTSGSGSASTDGR